MSPATTKDRPLPAVTVATLVHRDGRFLVVREDADGEVVINQPAGHLEPGETLLAAAVRETLEETAWQVRVTALLGIYDYTAPDGKTYIRHCFVAEPVSEVSGQALDNGILEALWLSYEEIADQGLALRSPMVLKCLDDYRRGQHFPLSLITSLDS